jgi:hypothetical protein
VSGTQTCSIGLFVLPVEGHSRRLVTGQPHTAVALNREGNGPGPELANWKFTDDQLAERQHSAVPIVVAV